MGPETDPGVGGSLWELGPFTANRNSQKSPEECTQLLLSTCKPALLSVLLTFVGGDVLGSSCGTKMHVLG